MGISLSLCLFYFFHGIKPKVSVIISKAITALFEFGLTSRKLCQTSIDMPFSSPSRWSAPCLGALKINCDGAYSDNLKLGLAAFAIRDYIGALVYGKISFYSSSSSVMVEAKAIFDVLMFLALCVYSPVIIESDCNDVNDDISLEAFVLPLDGEVRILTKTS